jgi:hypothetical protein
LLLSACGPDLPPGWEDAERVDDLVQTDCAGSPYEPFDERVEVDFAADPLVVDYLEAHFRCAQPVEAFARSGAHALDLLVQPEDMHPDAVAGCDCLYDITMRVEDGRAETVTVYRRWDDWNEPNEPVLVGSASR